MSNESLKFENMTVAEFEERLPDLFANGKGRVSEDPDVQRFLAQNPTCAALVRDLEYIAAAAGDMLKVNEDPSDNVWKKIQSQLDMDMAASGDETE